tara:strand:- start:630 stop:1118 length:489 start_codon:yes stop_codon:yes gene_type:complete
MAIRGRNLSASAQMFVKGLLGSATAGSSGAQMVSGLICAAVRSSIQVLEMGITVAKGTAGTANNTTTTATTSDLAIYYRKPGGAPVKLAGMVFPSGTAVGTEFTTRDATLAFEAAYDHPAKRVFPKGTIIGIEWDGDANGNTGAADLLVAYAYAPDFGAEPA